MISTLIVPTLSEYARLEIMLGSIDHPIDHIIVIDNGGNCPDLICSYAERLSILRMPNNLGVGASWNLGIQLSPQSERWLITNDDIQFVPGGLERLASTRNDGIVQDWSMDPRWSCFAISASVVRSVGLFDDYFWPGVGEEWNYQVRCKAEGIEMIHLKNWFTHDDASTRRKMRGWQDWSIIHMNEAIDGQIRRWSLERRLQMEAYLNGGPEIQPTSVSRHPEETGVTR